LRIFRIIGVNADLLGGCKAPKAASRIRSSANPEDQCRAYANARCSIENAIQLTAYRHCKPL
jgi:hypothetical protein